MILLHFFEMKFIIIVRHNASCCYFHHFGITTLSRTRFFGRFYCMRVSALEKGIDAVAVRC